MADTYCGRNCDTCTYKEKLNCPGCKNGPGQKLYGECRLSKCCYQKGQTDCGNCTENHYCGLLRRKDEVPQKRLTRREYERSQFEEMKRLSKPLGRWLWILFWLVIARELTGLLTNDTVVGLIPFLYTPALIFQAIFSLLYGGILVYLSFASRHYKIGGWCCIAAAIIGWSGLFTDPDGWGNVISIISSVVSLVGTYHVFYGHAEVLEFPDSDLAERWRKLFKWRVGMIAVNIGSVILALIPFLALLAMPAVIACAIAMVVVGILQIVYLYRTAKVFRNFPEEYPNRYSNLGPEQGEAGPTGQTAMIKKAAVEGDKKICPHCGQRQDKGNTICMNCGEMI